MKISKWAAPCVAAVLLAGSVVAEDGRERDSFGPNGGDWEFTLSGSGTSDRSVNFGGGGADAGLGFYITEMLEIGVRQSVTYSKPSDDSGSNWGGSTRGFFDVVFDLKAFRPFVGASLGYVYGDDTNDTWAAGLEAGVKIYVKPQTFLFGSIEYLWFFDSGSAADDNFDDGRFAYTVGIGFNF